MDVDSLLNTLDTIGHYGNIISTEESIVLHNSLLLLQNENHFRRIYFWGRIFGADKDYYIVYGFVKDALLGRIYYYSTNCTDWGLLPLPTDHGKSLTPLCTMKFQGDPAIVTEILIEKDETSFEKIVQVQHIRRLKEEDRLSATIYFINQEATMLPRGALFKRPDGVVVENLSYEGLTQLESRDAESYLHYREPLYKWNTNLLTRNDYNYAIDFLDPVDKDVPEGCFTIKLCAGGTLALVKPLYWPGMVFYHFVQTPKYGYVYFGHGKKSLDVSFMLNPF